MDTSTSKVETLTRCHPRPIFFYEGGEYDRVCRREKTLWILEICGRLYYDVPYRRTLAYLDLCPRNA